MGDRVEAWWCRKEASALRSGVLLHKLCENRSLPKAVLGLADYPIARATWTASHCLIPKYHRQTGPSLAVPSELDQTYSVPSETSCPADDVGLHPHLRSRRWKSRGTMGDRAWTFYIA